MNIIIVKNDEIMGIEAGKKILSKIKSKPNSVLGFATGSSPITTYKFLVNDYYINKTDWSKVITFNLDEYVGLDTSNQQSYYYFMMHNLFQEVNLNFENINIPCGKGDYEYLAKKYEEKIAAYGGIDLQLLGLGINGHIGFNEPLSSFSSRTRVVNLTKSTISSNSRFFKSIDDVPTKAVSMGLETIMEAKEILLLAAGEKKAQAIYQLVNGPIEEKWPCSILQKHPNVTLIIDQKAAKLLNK